MPVARNHMSRDLLTVAAGDRLGEDAGERLALHDEHGAHVAVAHPPRHLAQRVTGSDRQEITRHVVAGDRHGLTLIGSVNQRHDAHERRREHERGEEVADLHVGHVEQLQRDADDQDAAGARERVERLVLEDVLEEGGAE